VLQGEGKQVRYVPVATIAALRAPAVAQLIAEAARLGKPMPKTGRGQLIVKATANAKRSARKR
jgi:hypothetical protein